MAIRIGILGYGNLGRGVELAIQQNDDMVLTCIFTRRNPKDIKPLTENVAVCHVDWLEQKKDLVDVLICCGGSAKDLPEQTPMVAKWFNVVDSFDTHPRIEEHFQNVHAEAYGSNHLALISAGWDPGMFSLNRVLMTAILRSSKYYTFWGKGVSQGHSDAIRSKVAGVQNAKQDTVPIEEALAAVRNHEYPEIGPKEMHRRECYVVPEDGADLNAIEQAIKTMPDYFEGYETNVHFVTEEELQAEHGGMEHGGFVVCTGKTGVDGEHHQTIEYRLQLDSNPEFTACVLIAYARAIYRMWQRGRSGCCTVYDVAPGDLSPLSPEELRAHLL